MANEPEIIDIPDDDPVEETGLTLPEEKQKPVIVIERDLPTPAVGGTGKRNRLLLWAVTVAVGVIAVGVGLFVYFRVAKPGVPVSYSEKENIEIMEQPFSESKGGITVMRDTILGVGLEIYPLDGLRASLEYELPDTNDLSLVAFFRSADYTPDRMVIGEAVVDGKPLTFKDDDTRQAYIGISDRGRPVIGAGTGSEVMNYALENGGSFFRQYLLLSDNTLPGKFSLHGKVERAALGRMFDGRLYYVITRGRETMWGFADALREYGFVDAAYITGGDKYDFRRSPDGTYALGNKLREEYIEQRGQKTAAPMLVFRSRR